MATGKSQYLQPDPSVTASAAGDSFGGGTGNAELLVAANQLRYSEHLEAANLHAPDAEEKKNVSKADVEAAAGVEVLDYAVRGPYVTVVYEGAQGRVGKLTLHYDREDGTLERAETEDTPELAALRAQIEAGSKVEEAKREAQRLIEDAQAAAAKIAADAADEVAQLRAELEAERAKARSEATQNVGGEAGNAEAGKGPAAEPTPDPGIKGDMTEGGTKDPYEGLNADELRELADKRRLTVEGTGANGNVKGSDALKALQADDAAKA